MKNTITYNSELMVNYLAASIMDPADRFEALQDANGNALLFSISTDKILYVTCQSPQSQSGWTTSNISTAVMNGSYNGGTCVNFSAAQNITDGTIGLAMVVSAQNTNTIFLCLGNSNSDLSWLDSPVWVPYIYDYTTPLANPLEIANVFISETSNGQFICADLNINGLISRYYINPNPSAETHWTFCPLNIDLDATNYFGAIGRKAKGNGVDGIYSGGQINGVAQLMYCPLFNAFGQNPPTVNPLQLPGKLIPNALCTFHNGGNDGSTDLLVTAVDESGNGSLYYFASTNQEPNATGTLLYQDPLLINVSKLFASVTNGILTVWGLNGADQVFYLTCTYTPGSPQGWSIPVPILSNVDMMSPFINLQNGGNTIFAIGEGMIYVISKSPQTNLWTTSRITMPAPLPSSPAIKFSSYTTRIQVADENNQAVPFAQILLSANTRSSFYINGLYYILDSTPVPVDTDAQGAVTLIETVTNLTGTKITVSESGSNSITINPMDTPMNKVAQLNTVDALQNAVITKNDGTVIPLVPAGQSNTDLQTAATANANLFQVYSNFSNPDKNSLFLNNHKAVQSVFDNSILVDIGDLFNWLASGIEAVVDFVENVATGFWHMVVRIGDAIYEGILTCVEHVVAAVEWVFNAIKTLIEDLISFLEFLFLWKDILTTHKVMKNVMTQFVSYSINNLSSFSGTLEADVNTIISDIDQWAGITAFSQTPNGLTSANPPSASLSGAPSNLGIHHFQNNASASNTSYTPPSIGDEIFQDLINLLNEQEQDFTDAIQAIQTQIIDQIGSLSGTEILQKFLAIIADTLLQSAAKIIECLVTIIVQLSSGVMDMLDAPLDIPVLSSLYSDISGGDQLSFLDLFSLIGAIPATIVYKAATGSVPFPQDSTLTEGLINATSFDEVKNLLTNTGVENYNLGKSTEDTGQELEVSQNPLDIWAFITGIYTVPATIGMIIASVSEIKTNTMALLNATCNVYYVSTDIVGALSNSSRWDIILNDIFAGISIVKGFTFDVKFYQEAPSQILEAILNLFWNIPVISNIAYSTGDKYYKELTSDTIGNFCFNFGGMVTPFTKSKYVQIAQFGLMGIYSASMVVSGSMKLALGQPETTSVSGNVI